MRQVFTFLLLIVLSCTVQFSWAVSAYPGFVNHRQPDGTFIRVRMMGDEHLHWAETEDGYTLLNDSIGFLTLALRDAEGNLTPSEFRMVNISDRTPLLKAKMLQVAKHEAFAEPQVATARAKARLASPARVIKNDEPVVGTRKYLVILMQFQDVKFQISKDKFDHQLNDIHPTTTVDGSTGSVHDFYEENSFGQLDLQCDVVGVYTAAHNMAYYGNNSNGQLTTLAVEALTAASKEVNLSDYDANNDGYIDGVHIIFAGHGEEAGGGSDCIWSCEVTTTGYFCSINGKKMNAFSCTPELRDGSGNSMSYIGVICHEIGHALGTLDFYDTNYTTGGSYPGTGNWDVMGSGNWNNSGATPAHFNPYSKIYDFGWSDVRDGNKSTTAKLTAKTKGSYIRIDTKTDDEYFLLEYKSNTGFDANTPGHGLMVYRATGLSIATGDYNATHKQHFYPLCANASAAIPTSTASTYGIPNASSASFPGSLGKTELTDETTPSMKSWDGENTALPVTDISENTSEESVSFNIAGGGTHAYSFEVTARSATEISLEWKKDDSMKVMLVFNDSDSFGKPSNKNYTSGDVIDGGGIVLYVGTEYTYSHLGLNNASYYYYHLYSLQENGTWEEDGSLKVRTLGGIVNEFPFTEDFDSQVLDDKWQNECVEGTNFWEVANLWNSGKYVLYYTWKEGCGSRQSTRAILPTLDMTGHQNALLEFDYRNMLDHLQVVYRSSKEGEWILLQELPQASASGMTAQDAFNAVRHASISLPNITSANEVGIVADITSSAASTYKVATIDNVRVSVDYDNYIETRSATNISLEGAKVEFYYIPGLDSIVSSKGIEWSIDQKVWTRITASSNTEILSLVNLPEATKIYYRAYVETKTKTCKGKILSFSTLSSKIGAGTIDDPFLIYNVSDWNTMAKEVNAGNDKNGVYYRLESDLALGYDNVVSSPFNGILDGNGYSITVSSTSSNRIKGIFVSLGGNSEVKNLKIIAGDQLFFTGWKNALLSMENYGHIHDCEAEIENIIFDVIPDFGPFVGFNYGKVIRCTSEIGYLFSPEGGTYVGGICGWNIDGGFIEDCVFNGHICSNNNSHIGGIVGLNWQGEPCINRCVNNGTIEVLVVDGKAWINSVGGIAGSNYGNITQCINRGNVISRSTGDVSSSIIGGLVGYNCAGGLVNECYSTGVVTVAQNDINDHIGGFVGYADGDVKNSYAAFEYELLTSNLSQVKGFVSVVRDGSVENCFYTSNGRSDTHATLITSDHLASQTFTDKLNSVSGRNTWILRDKGYPELMWEINEDINNHPDYSSVENVIYIDDATSKLGRNITLPILMNNTASISAFEFELFVPTGVSVLKDSIGNYAIKCVEDRSADGTHIIDIKKVDSNRYTIVCSASDNSVFTGSKGTVAEITLSLSKDIDTDVVGIILRNQKLIHPDKKYETFDAAYTAIVVASYTLGDVNDDDKIDYNDVDGTINLILEKNIEGLISSSADINKDGKINTGDCVGIINYAKYGEFIHENTSVIKKSSVPYSGTPSTPQKVTSSNYQSLGLTAEHIGYYAIGTAEELYGYSGGNAVLTNDIVVNENVLDFEGNLNGVPIYKWKLRSNSSIFDGNGHTISGLYYTDSSSQQIGFFTSNSGTIKNLGIVDSYFSGIWANGALVGSNNGTVTNCYSSSTVCETANGRNGGIVGYNSGSGTIYKCFNTGKICGYSGEDGGVCGSNNGGRISCCYNLGKVVAESTKANYVGGVAGTSWSTLTNCFNMGDVTNNAKTYGSVCGGESGGISRCYALTKPLLGSHSDATGYAAQMTEEQFADGTVCDLLNQGMNEAVWSQGKSGYPILGFWDKGGTVTHPDYSLIDDVIYIDDVNGFAGAQLTIPVYINNASGATACQFDVYLPKGITVSDTDTKSSVSSHILHYAQMNGGFTRFVCISDNNEEIKKGNSQIVTLALNINDEVDENDYQILVCNQYLTLQNTSSIIYNKSIANISVTNEGYALGDANNDKVIDDKDVDGIIDYILENNTTGLIAKAADVNKDNILNAGDCVGIYNHQLYGYFTPENNTSQNISRSAYNGTSSTPKVVTASNYKALGLTSDFIGYYAIGSAEELYGFAKIVNGGSASSNGVLLNDIIINENVLKSNGDLNGTPSYSWTSLSTFKGVFDGNYHSISGIYTLSSASSNTGFCYSNYGTIKNLGILDSYIKGTYYNGAIVSYNYEGATIENCYSHATVTESKSGRTGGIVGYNRSKVYRCYNAGRIQAYTGQVGGICGSNDTGGDILCCYNLGSVEANSSRAGNLGGITGTNWSRVKYCYNTGSVSTNATYYGSISGESNGGFGYCYALTKPLLASISVTDGLAFQMNSEQFADGTVCKLLNEDLNEPVWIQGNDGHPVFYFDYNGKGSDKEGYIKHPDYSMGNNLVYVNDVEFTTGNTITIPVYLNSTKDITAYQFDLYLPEGVHCSNNGIKSVSNKHYIRYATLPNGATRVICLSKTNTILDSKPTIVAEISLNVDNSLDNICYPAYIRNQYVTMCNTKSMTYDEVVFNMMPGEVVPDSFDHPDYSEEDNIIYIEDFSASKNKTVDIPVLMNNSEDIVGYQYDLYLPEGITIASDDEGEMIFNGSRTSSRYPHSLEWQQQSDGSVRILSYSAKGTVFTGTSGDITKITLMIGDSSKADSCLIAIKNIVLSKTDGSTIEKPASYAVVRFSQSYTRGDVNSDGKINVGDISCIAGIILGTAADNLIEAAADANLDGKINVGDISSVAGFILNGSFVSVQNVSYAGACFYPQLTMQDMVMSAGKEQTGVLYLSDPSEIFSLQFDICLPDGISIKQDDNDYCISQVYVSSKGHTLDWAVQEDGSLRIINFSATNKCFADNKNGVIDIEFVADEAMSPGNYEIILKNIVLAGANGTTELGDRTVQLSIDGASGLENITEEDSYQVIYTITGIRKNKVSKGINIINNHKYIVK